MKPRFAIGVDFGATTVKTGLVSSAGKILYQNKLPTNGHSGPSAVIKQIEASVRDALSRADGKKTAGIGIGSPGVVDDHGVVKSPPNIPQWDEVPLARTIGKIFPRHRIKVENDANAAAIAESRFGAGKKYPNFLFVIWGTGVGGGIILNNRIYRGPTGGAGEIGHISIDYNGAECNCGNRGCVEAYIGQRYLSQRTTEKLKSRPDSKILELVNGDQSKLEPMYLAQAARQGDQLAREMLTEAGEMLGVAIAAVMNVMDLRVSIIGGGISAAGDFVIEAIEQSVRSRVLKPLRPGIKVLQARLGNDAGILGAAGLVL
ncbi:MAG: ROK family protein [Ignavibacteriales bacterium]|nr:ROK family protein [Ignavibacteriales bacterium]